MMSPENRDAFPISDKIEQVAESELQAWYCSQANDMEPKPRTRTLREVLMSVYVQGVIDGAQAQQRTDNDALSIGTEPTNR